MGTCLVTTLKEAVTDFSLLKLGEFVVHKTDDNPNDNSVKRLSVIAGIDGTTITILGDGYITDETRTANLGKTITLVANQGKYVHLSTGEYDIKISNKYTLNSLTCSGIAIYMNADDFYGFTNIVNMVVRCHVDIARLSQSSNLVSLMMRELSYGDINVLSSLSSLNSVYFGAADGIYGDILDLSGNIALVNLDLSGTNVTGSLSSLSSLTNLTLLRLDNTDVTGDTSDLAGLTNLTTFTYTNTAITGTWPLV